ncbi:MAG: zinc ABC transporter substrate-binding protein [Candidatus Bathyarchaeota archaeon]|nr:zinc ABC transporter substrate-binding protein [Candidatus Bathyarchaeota archaeon]
MKKTRVTVIVVTLFLGLLLTSMCFYFARQNASGMYSNVSGEKIIVVVTLPPQAEFVEKVGDDKVRVVVMIPQGANPHIYEPTPDQLKNVSKARIYFKVGSGLEFEEAWLDKILALNPSISVVDGSKGIEILDRDPHIWVSPVNAKKMVENFYTGLVEVDPLHKDEYKTNMEKYLEELDKLDSYIQNKLARFTNKVFLIYHPSLDYLAKEYNLTQISIEHEGKEPSPQTIQKCIKYAKKYHLSYVYVEPYFTTKYAETIAREVGGEVILLNSLPRNYVDGIKSVVDLLSLEFE